MRSIQSLRCCCFCASRRQQFLIGVLSMYVSTPLTLPTSQNFRSVDQKFLRFGSEEQNSISMYKYAGARKSDMYLTVGDNFP